MRGRILRSEICQSQPRAGGGAGAALDPKADPWRGFLPALRPQGVEKKKGDGGGRQFWGPPSPAPHRAASHPRGGGVGAGEKPRHPMAAMFGF